MPHNAHQPVKGSKAGGKVGKGRTDGPSQPQQLMGFKVTARRQTVGRPQLEEHPADEHIGNVGKHIFTEFICHHA